MIRIPIASVNRVLLLFCYFLIIHLLTELAKEISERLVFRLVINCHTCRTKGSGSFALNLKKK